MAEIREIPGTDGKYFVSSDGRAFRNLGEGLQELRQSDCQGYRTVSVRFGRVLRTIGVHRAIGLAFLDVTSRQVVDHINGNRSDNRLENLRAVSYSDNNRLAIKQGLRKVKLTKEKIQEIRYLVSLKIYTLQQIAEKIGVTAGSVSKVKLGKVKFTVEM
jgi:hypothetical protein